ncbi:MAG: recN [Fibrobacteria bacterium]|jgi:DNA repair protein RecN (Recombination protein N)|nr:recN [Fibrobacteria bacterium]
MLRTLSIRNLAILPEAEMAFAPGFTVLTGETGAGKSILINALKLILGAKSKTDLIRQGADKLRVEAVFDLPPSPALRALLKNLELDVEDDLVLERELTAAGKNRARVNGTLVTLSDLDAIGRHLVDLHGQHEQQGLLEAGTHGGYLDGYAGLSAEAEAYAVSYRAFRGAEQQLKQAGEEATRLQEQIDFLQFQFKELDKADLGESAGTAALGNAKAAAEGSGEGEENAEERIERELKLLGGFEKISAGRDACLDSLEGPQGALTALGRLQREFHGLSRHLESERFSEQDEKIESARAALEEVRASLRALNVPEEADPERIDALNARLALFQRLKAKYKTDLGGLIALRERRAAEIARVTDAGIETASMTAARDEALADARKRGAALSKQRRAAAQKFDAEVNARLARLGMEGSRFEARVQPLPAGELGSAGLDQVEFFLAANPGEPSRPLRQSASGGEISRVMLAIKGALAQSDPRPLLVFDELDTGIGGQTGLRVGEALAELSTHHQLLVITHLHQVAAQAAHQHKVEKRLEGGRTVTGVLPLSARERAAELARMMGGEESSLALKHAKELLKKMA